MSEAPTEKNGISWSIQDILSLGYLYLLIVGIAGESIYYHFLGINILSYSSVIDILLSPIVQLVRVPALAIIFVVIPGGMYVMFYFLGQRHQKKKEEDPTYRERKDFEKLDQAYSKKSTRTGWMIYTMFIIFGGYIGFGLGGGQKMKSKIDQGQMKTDRVVYFIDGDKKEVTLIGHNSDYLFYVEKAHQKMTVVPIPGNVKMIGRLDDVETGDEGEKDN